MKSGPTPQCHPQTDGPFNPSKSTTYRAFTGSSTCRVPPLGPYANGNTPAGDQCERRVRPIPRWRGALGRHIHLHAQPGQPGQLLDTNKLVTK